MAFPLPCPNCGRFIRSDVLHCPHCHLLRPAERWGRRLRGVVSTDPQGLTRAVVYVNVALFAASLLLAPGRAGFSPNPLRFLSPSDGSLLLLGATGTLPIDALGRWWTLVSANYLHGSVLHIFFNMAALTQLGPLVIREYGASRSAILYALGGALSFLVSYYAGVRFTIGASGAVCALIGATLYYGRSRGGIYGQAVFRHVWGWAVGIFVFGFLIPGINNWAHGGGMAAGFVLGALLGYEERGRERPAHRWAAALCVLGTLAVLAGAVVTAAVARVAG